MKTAPTQTVNRADVERERAKELAREKARMNTSGIIALVMAVAALVLGIIAKSI